MLLTTWSPLGRAPWPGKRGSSSRPFLRRRSLVPSAAAPDLGRGVTPLGCRPSGVGSSRLLPLTSDVGWLLSAALSELVAAAWSYSPASRPGVAARRSNPRPSQGRWLGGPTPCPRSRGCAGAGGPRGAITHWRSGRAAVRRYPSSKVRSNGCALLEQLWRDTPRPR